MEGYLRNKDKKANFKTKEMASPVNWKCSLKSLKSLKCINFMEEKI